MNICSLHEKDYKFYFFCDGLRLSLHLIPNDAIYKACLVFETSNVNVLGLAVNSRRLSLGLELSVLYSQAGDHVQ